MEILKKDDSDMSTVDKIVYQIEQAKKRISKAESLLDKFIKKKEKER